MKTRWYILLIVGILCWLLLLLGLAGPAWAEEPAPIVPEHFVGPPRYVAFIADLNAPPVGVE